MPTVYIAPTAQGSANGTSAANAYAYSSLSTAESDAGTGGLIYFLDGTYTTTIPNFQADSITYQSLNLHGAIFQPSSFSYMNLADSTTPTGITLKDFVFKDLRLFTTSHTGSSLVDNCKFESTGNFNSYLWNLGNSNVTVQNCTANISFSDPTEIIISNATNGTLKHNSLYIRPQSSVNSAGLTTSAIGTSKNNIFVSTDSSKIGTNIATNSSNCCFNDFGTQSGGTNNLFDDPQFVDAPNGDLRLRPSSPCIGAATAS